MATLETVAQEVTSYGNERYEEGRVSRESEITELKNEIDLAQALAEEVHAANEARINELQNSLRISKENAAALQAEIDRLKTPTETRDKPIDYVDLDDFIKRNPNAPQDKSLYMMCPTGLTLEEVFMSMPSKEMILVLDKGQKVILDTSDGFRAAGAGAVLGQNNKRLPVVSTYKGKAARTWFAMARAQRGMIGLDRGSEVLLSDSAFRQEKQIEDKGSPLPGGGTSPGRFWYDTAGNQKSELVGSQEKLIESVHASPVFANFKIRGRDFGGVAYSALSGKGGWFSRLDLDGAWRGFSGVPNGETAAISISGGVYLISRVSTSPLDEKGNRVGSSPIMINRSPGGRWEYGDASQVAAGMPTWWSCSGKHVLHDVKSRWGIGPGLNIEQAGDGFELVWTGGICWPNRNNQGGNPSPDGRFANNVLHFGIHALGRAKVTIEEVDFDRNVVPNKVCVQLYGASTDPKKVTITATKDGKSIPIAAYGVGGQVALANQ